MNFKESRQITGQLKSIDSKLHEYESLSSKYEKDVLKYSEAYLENERKTILASMPIEELSRYKLGIRVSALRNAGITTIEQLHKTPVKTLIAIKGIGENSAYKAAALCREIIKKLDSDTRIRISPDDARPEADRLVSSLYKANASAAVSKKASDIYSSTHSKIKSLLKKTRPLRNRLFWLITPENLKNTALESLKEAEAVLAGSYKDDFEELFKKEQQILKATHNEYWNDFAKNSANYYSRIEHVRQQSLRRSSESLENKELAIKNGLSETLINRIEAVDLKLTGLKCIPRKYQAFGIKYVLNQGSVLLGDEMGLGKTIQAIGTMVALRNSGETHFIVVCPNSVLINWQREIQKHSDLSPVILHGRDLEASLETWKENGGVGISTYEAIGKFSLAEDFRIAILVADEAHYVKNPGAQRTRALLSLMEHADRKLFMTGTALENNINEMLFLIECLRPDIASELKNLTDHENAAQFRTTAAPVYFRRVREDVLTELPSKIEKEEWCRMTAAESDKYCESVMAGDFMAMRQVSWNVDSLNDSSKAEHLMKLCETSMQTGRKVIVFSFFINTINQVQAMFDENICYGPITGSISTEKRQHIIDEFSDAQGGAILLSQIQAGGTGLNIQAASTVIFCEPQLKPSLENQAVSRAYRMGQVNTVLVYRLLCENSVDEQIMNLLNHKQALFDAFANESVSGDESLQLSINDSSSIIDAELQRLQNELAG